jgi:hypothetical protein
MRVEDDELRELCELATLVDELDAEASVGAEPYSNVELDALLCAKRDRLLIELEVADVLSGHERARLEGLGLANLVGYSDAAVEMDRYLDSPGFARLVKEPRPTRLLDSQVSLDWFRKSTGYVPPGVDRYDWLALCERNFRGNNPRAGSSWVRLEDHVHRLMFRTELNKPRLYRATSG